MIKAFHGRRGRAMTAAAEYWVPRAAIAAVRALDRDVIGQADRPGAGPGG